MIKFNQYNTYGRGEGSGVVLRPEGGRGAEDPKRGEGRRGGGKVGV